MTMELKYFKIKVCLSVIRAAELEFKAEKFKVQNMADKLTKFSLNEDGIRHFKCSASNQTFF